MIKLTTTVVFICVKLSTLLYTFNLQNQKHSTENLTRPTKHTYYLHLQDINFKHHCTNFKDIYFGICCVTLNEDQV